MKRDPLKQYVSLRDSLLKRKATLEAELEKINAALGEAGPVAAPVAKARVKAAPAGRKRAKNSISLKAAVSQVLADKALTKPEILKAVTKLGYEFTAKDPTNSLNTLLYSDKSFKNQGDGKFALA